MRTRRDGWTPERQLRFLELLSQSGSVQKAALAVGMSASGAYRFRMRASRAFVQRWDDAHEIALSAVIDSAMERAIHGTVNPVFYKGEIMGERVTHDSRLSIFLLKMSLPSLFGQGAGNSASPVLNRETGTSEVEERVARIREKALAISQPSL